MKVLAHAAVLILLAVPSHGASIEGDITLNYTNVNTGGAVFRKEFGDVLRITCAWRAGEVSGKEAVFAGGTARNTGSKAMWFQYFVAFYDKDRKLVGTAAQIFSGRDGVKPGKSTRLRSARIYLPRGKYKEIVSYQAIIYELDTPLQKSGSILLEDP